MKWSLERFLWHQMIDEFHNHIWGTRAVNTRSITLAIVVVVGMMTIVSCSGLNGTHIEPARGAKGECAFTIANGYEEDIAVKFFTVEDMQSHVYYIYVSSGKTATIKDMAPGNYVLRYSKGSEWDVKSRMFTTNRKNFETDQKFTLETKEYTQETGRGKHTVRQSTHQTFMLGSGSGEGNISTQEIPDNEFGK